ncbi:type II secretion system F family protein [Modestobacter excelsi]|uniref:type II secretion system F family protein n=1 Tax=Modestobacter excelsi TaxID=2213161 RepID=UPI00110CA210|nr:type II secretion system F family protein [Modestobacter excelsi]
MATVLLLVGIAAVAGALLLVALVVLPAGPPRLPLSRLDPSVPAPPSALAGPAAVARDAVHRILVRRGRTAAGAAALERAGVSTPLADVVLLVGVATLVLAAVGALLGGLLPAVLLAGAGPLGAKALLAFRTGRRQAAFADQLDDSLQLMASSLRAGHSLLRALDSVSHEAASPTAEEFARIVNETRVGRELADALDEVAARTASEDFTWVAQAIAIHREVGGNLAEVLDSVGHTIRERNAIRRQVKALAAEGKLSAIVLMALPFGVTAFLSLSNPAYLAKFTQSLAGWALLAAALVMMVVGGLWLKKTVAIRF